MAVVDADEHKLRGHVFDEYLADHENRRPRRGMHRVMLRRDATVSPLDGREGRGTGSQSAELLAGFGIG